MEYLTTALEFIQGVTFGEWVAALTGVIASCSAITALTPTKTDDKIINGILSVLNFLALNVIKNKNADSE
jgi:hypothetical protein